VICLGSAAGEAATDSGSGVVVFCSCFGAAFCRDSGVAGTTLCWSIPVARVVVCSASEGVICSEAAEDSSSAVVGVITR
jgi:hypothetical protein